jgi:hypothetical protein
MKLCQLKEKEKKLVNGGFNLKQELKNVAGGAADIADKAGEWLNKVSGNLEKAEEIAVVEVPPVASQSVLTYNWCTCQSTDGTLVHYNKPTYVKP